MIRKGGVAMTDFRQYRFFTLVLTLLVVFAMFAGCARLKNARTKKAKPVATATKKSEAPEPLYYDFGDVLVPSELKEDRNRSFVYHAPGFTAGVLVLTGRVETNSLIRFFENNMAKDNWQLVGVFRSPRTIMFFNKVTRSCIVNITEKRSKTEVEIWVAPTMEDEESGFLK